MIRALLVTLTVADPTPVPSPPAPPITFALQGGVDVTCPGNLGTLYSDEEGLIPDLGAPHLAWELGGFIRRRDSNGWEGGFSARTTGVDIEYDDQFGNAQGTYRQDELYLLAGGGWHFRDEAFFDAMAGMRRLTLAAHGGTPGEVDWTPVLEGRFRANAFHLHPFGTLSPHGEERTLSIGPLIVVGSRLDRLVPYWGPPWYLRLGMGAEMRF